MKTICKITLLCFILNFVFGNFSFANAAEAGQEDFMNKKVPAIKYFFSDEYIQTMYKFKHDNGYKYAVSPRLLTLSAITGTMGIGYIGYFTVYFISIIPDFFSFEGFPPMDERKALICGGLFGVLALCPLLIKIRPGEFEQFRKQNRKTQDLELPYEKKTFFYDVLGCSFLSAFTGLYFGGLANYLIYGNGVYSGLQEKGVIYGFCAGIVLGLLGVKNLDKMFKNKESKLELYPNILLVDKNNPTITLNLAYRF